MINVDELRQVIDSCDVIDIRRLFLESGLEFEIPKQDGHGDIVQIEMNFDEDMFKAELLRMLDRI